MYICVYIYVHIFEYIYIYIYIELLNYIYMCIHIFNYIHIYKLYVLYIPDIGLAVRVFANPRSSHTKDSKNGT